LFGHDLQYLAKQNIGQKKRRRGRRFSVKQSLLLQAAARKALIKAIYSATSINNFLLARKERMALTANVN